MNYFYQMALTIQNGIDFFLKKNAWKGKKLAMLTNDAAYTGHQVKSRVALLKAGFQISFLFSPEHGLSASAPDGASVPDKRDEVTGLPVYSLYGENLGVDTRLLEQVDAVVYDIPDVGCRFYTYLWSLSYLMEACAQIGKPLLVLDRPNPLGGDMATVEGPMLDEEKCASFIGRWNIPIRHSCTTGELARMFKDQYLPELLLEIIPCSGWNRLKDLIEQGGVFFPTSPAIQNLGTAFLYAGFGLLEGINIQEGRGTNFAFRQVGAPWVDPHKWTQLLQGPEAQGVVFVPVQFKPAWGLYQDQECNGLFFTVTDKMKFKPVQFALHVISALMKLYPEKVLPRFYKTMANPTGERHLDLLTGVPGSFEKLMAGQSFEVEVAADWLATMTQYILYD